MFQLTNAILAEFRRCFKREISWRWFVVLVLGFMMRQDHRGVTSVVTAMRVEPQFYRHLLHFFRSSAYSMEALWQAWIRIASRYRTPSDANARLVLIGDHIKISKEALRQPNIEVLHQDSSNSGKPEYITGHIFGQVGSMIGDGKTWRYMPLRTEMHISGTKGDEGSLVAQMVKQALKVAKDSNETSAVVVLDAYFSSRVAWDIIDATTDSKGQRVLDIVTRAQTNTTAYEKPIPSECAKRGRPRLYGDKVTLYKLFDDQQGFNSTTISLYGKDANLRYLCLDLLWKPVKKLVRFVLVQLKDGSRCVLMCSDLQMHPQEIIQLYSLRFKIETSFDEQKNDLGSFAYRFWTTALARRSKWKDAAIPVSATPHQLKLIAKARQAIEAFVLLNTIATGILTLIAFHHNREIWERYPGWMRTVRSLFPSIYTTKLSFSHDFHAQLSELAFFPSFSHLPKLLRRVQYLYRTA